MFYSSVTVEENEQVVAYALARRPNVKLVETNLPFGKEGFTSFMGKSFPPSLKLTRRYYPHTYNVDGFFVAKFQKTGPTPLNAVLADKSNKGPTNASRDANEVIDKTPIAGDDENPGEDDGFGGFEEEEDQQYIERAKRNAMRRRGLDPKALNRKGAGSKSKKEASKDSSKEESS